MIIDSHVHLKHGDAAGTEYSPAAIVEIMNAAGIDRSVVFAISTSARRAIEMAAEATEMFPDRLIPYAYAIPSFERPVDLQAATRMATDFPDLKLIVCHFGLYLASRPEQVEPFIALAEERANVWLDASGVLMDWMIADAASRIGADRVLFGTDGPHAQPDLVEMARRCVRQIQNLELPEADRTMILGGSIAKLLDL
jgi:Tat protein secretion system quality control protein TatD with DNase activity